jgi:MFS family permease
MFVMLGAAYSFTAFFSPLQQTSGATRGDVSLAFSINVPLFYLMGAISGPMADRFGSRATCLLGCLLGSAGLAFAATATALWQVYAGFGLLLGIGIGFAFVPSVASVQRWFAKRRGLASGIAVSGIGFGTLILPFVATPLMGVVGWRGAWCAFAVMVLVVSGGASLFISNSPEKFGALPDGGVIGAEAGTKAATVAGAGVREAVFSRPFLLLYLSLFIIWSGVSIPFVHLVPIAEDSGFSHNTAVAMFGLVGIGSIAGRFLLGGVADRLGRRLCLAIAFGASDCWKPGC